MNKTIITLLLAWMTAAGATFAASGNSQKHDRNMENLKLTEEWDKYNCKNEMYSFFIRNVHKNRKYSLG